MKCPHCSIAFHDEFFEETLHSRNTATALTDDKDIVKTLSQTCPECGKAIVYLDCGSYHYPVDLQSRTLAPYWLSKRRFLVYPKGTNRPPIPPEVPSELADDYKEACLVFTDSAKASAALSRRCLQSLLENYAKVKKGDLSVEIQEIMDSGKLPSEIVSAIDAVRNIGNFAAHPLKSTASGQIVDVEQGEAEWLLDTLEALFDHYFVQPEILKKKKSALDAKLAAFGKPPMK
jgi:hypothetical protein